MKVLKWLDEHFEETVMVITGTLIAIIIMFQVIMRYFFHHALPWPEEFCRFCYIYFVFMSLGYSIRNHSMLNVTIIRDMFPRQLRMVIEILLQVMMLAAFAVFTYGTVGLIQTTAMSGQKSTAMQIPMVVPYFATLIGFGLATLRAAQSTIHSIIVFKQGGDTKVSALEALEDELSDEVKAQMKGGKH